MTISAIVQLLGGVRATIFAVLGVALGATLLVQSIRLDSAQDKIKEKEAALAGYQAAQTINLATIDDLREANSAWARKCQVDPAATNQASQDTAQDNGALPVDDQRRADERTRAYEQDASAADWGRARVPAGIADRLRK